MVQYRKAAVGNLIGLNRTMVGTSEAPTPGKVVGAAAPAPAPIGKRSRDGSDAAASTALHRSRMFNWKPAAVVAISACPGAPMVAVGYETGDLELYDIHIMTCIQVGSRLCTMHTQVFRRFCTLHHGMRRYPGRQAQT